jgi:L-ascorbate metabolism protein UlaG (beta-lactamase superfamily)
MSTNTVTWHGGAGTELDINGRRLMVDPYSIREEVATPHYVCVTHNDHDHFDQTSIARFAADPAFEHLIVPPSCTVVNQLDSPVVGLYRELDFLSESRKTVMYPKYTREPDDEYSGPVEIELGEEYLVQTIDTSERAERYRVDPTAVPLWPEAKGPHAGHTRFPNLGYHITSKSTGLTFFQPGDLREQFNAHYELAGNIDVLFFPLTKLIGQENTFIEVLRPRYIIPMHYRVFEDGFPIPYGVPEGTDTYPTAMDEFQQVNQLLMNSHWYPSPDDALGELESWRQGWKDRGAELIVIKAGVPFDLAQLA